MENILPNLPQALFFTGGVVHIVTVFINFNNHDASSHIQEKVRPSPGEPIFYPLVTLPGDIGELFFKKSCNSVLLRPIIPCNRFIRKQIGKAIPTVSIIFRIFMGRIVWGFAQPTTITIPAILFLFLVLTKAISTTKVTKSLSLAMWAIVLCVVPLSLPLPDVCCTTIHHLPKSSVAILLRHCGTMKGIPFDPFKFPLIDVCFFNLMHLKIWENLYIPLKLCTYTQPNTPCMIHIHLYWRTYITDPFCSQSGEAWKQIASRRM